VRIMKIVEQLPNTKAGNHGVSLFNYIPCSEKYLAAPE
jgi:hypothetical protein